MSKCWPPSTSVTERWKSSGLTDCWSHLHLFCVVVVVVEVSEVVVMLVVEEVVVMLVVEEVVVVAVAMVGGCDG